MKFIAISYSLLLIAVLSIDNGSAFLPKLFGKSKLTEKLASLKNWIPSIPWINQNNTVNLPKTITFHLFTRNNPNNSEIYDASRNYFSGFKQINPAHPTKIVVHGWMGSINATVSTLLKNTYLEVGEYNVIILDWSKEAKRFYPQATEAVPEIAEILARFIDQLVSVHKIKAQDLHVIGHSLGAHVSGIAGSYIYSGKIGRITGLDPALPMFQSQYAERLTNTSATFVDVIHTCGMYLGFFETIGQVDFYPNQGVLAQPGCGYDVLGKCSHRRAYYYFAESIKYPDRFLATQCDNWWDFKKGKCGTLNVLMGEACPPSTRGVFYLLTAAQEPFGKGKDSIKVPNDFKSSEEES